MNRFQSSCTWVNVPSVNNFILNSCPLSLPMILSIPQLRETLPKALSPPISLHFLFRPTSPSSTRSWIVMQRHRWCVVTVIGVPTTERQSREWKLFAAEGAEDFVDLAHYGILQGKAQRVGISSGVETEVSDADSTRIHGKRWCLNMLILRACMMHNHRVNLRVFRIALPYESQTQKLDCLFNLIHQVRTEVPLSA